MWTLAVRGSLLLSRGEVPEGAAGRAEGCASGSTFRKSALEAEAVVVTCRPQALAIWMATEPTPPEPAWMSTRCPGCRLPGFRACAAEGARYDHQAALPGKNELRSCTITCLASTVVKRFHLSSKM